MLFEEDMETPLRNLMTTGDKLIKADEGISLEKARQILHKNRIEKLRWSISRASSRRW